MNIKTLLIMLAIVLVVAAVIYISWSRTSGRKLNIGLAIFPLLIATATGGYLLLGNPLGADPSKQFSENGDVEQFVNAVTTLEKKAAADPNNLDYQIMLAHSYRAMGRYDQSVAAFGKAWERVKNDPQELSLFAGTLAVWHGSFEGKPDELLSQALKIESNHPDALMLSGGSAYQKKQYKKAIDLWKKIPLSKLEENDKEWVEAQIADAEKMLTLPSENKVSHPN